MARFLENSLHLPLTDVLPYMQDRIMSGCKYFGIPTQTNPLDLWIYQEILIERRPDVIVEIGNCYGGSALAVAHICDAIGHGRVIAVDIDHDRIYDLARSHPRIEYVTGDAPLVADKVYAKIDANEHVMVIEDSSHTFENTLAVLRAYQALIKHGDYFIVEDGICHHGLDVGPSPGPYEAIDVFVGENDFFEIDRSRESFLITWNPKGFLRRR